jgi:hypothetical protein
VFKHFNAKATPEFGVRNKGEIEINNELAQRLRFDMDDNCNISEIKNYLYEISERYTDEDKFIARLKDEWRVGEPDPYLRKAVKDIDMQVLGAVKDLYLGNVSL